MNLQVTGAVLDVAVSDLPRAEAFYTTLLGRRADLRPQPDQLEWRLHADPEIALRVTAETPSPGTGRLALGVADLAVETARLLEIWPDLPEPKEKPRVIRTLDFHDPDGNRVTLWQDLLRSPG
jgi:catechol 2,3-dioxygenase-like lactoylglutathione lyase family enzyme